MKEDKRQEDYVYRLVGVIARMIDIAQDSLSPKYYSYFKEQLLDMLNEYEVR